MPDAPLPSSITPESLGSPPRKVRRKPQGRLGAIIGYLIASAILSLALLLVGTTLIVLLTMTLGVNLPGRIDSANFDSNDDGQAMTKVTYTFQVNGQTVSDSVRVPDSDYQSFLLTQPPQDPHSDITVNYFQLGPFSYSRLTHFTSVNGIPLAVLIGSCLVFAIALAVALCVSLCIGDPIKALCIHGIAVQGKILSKHEEFSGEDTVQYVTYTYVPPRAASPRTVETKLGAEQFSQFKHITPDQAVIILCHPTDPDLTCIYELTDFQVLP